MSPNLLEVLAGCRAYVHKMEVPQVCKNPVWLHGLSIREHLGVVVDCAAGGEQIFVSIVIEVEYSVAPTGCGHHLAADSARISYVHEQPLAQISKQRKGFGGVGNHPEILAPVVIDVARVRTHRA